MIRTSILAAGVAISLLGGAAIAQTASDDKAAAQKFLTNAMEGDYAEIAVGKLAQEKGASQGVKDFGAKLVADHTAHLDKAKQVASQLGVKDPGGASILENAEYLKLKVLSGSTFDSTFAKDMVSDHESTIEDFRKEAANSGPAGEFAKASLPTLEQHLQIAQSLTQQTTGSK
jgi:putative membrane protein